MRGRFYYGYAARVEGPLTAMVSDEIGGQINYDGVAPSPARCYDYADQCITQAVGRLLLSGGHADSFNDAIAYKNAWLIAGWVREASYCEVAA